MKEKSSEVNFRVIFIFQNGRTENGRKEIDDWNFHFFFHSLHSPVKFLEIHFRLNFKIIGLKK